MGVKAGDIILEFNGEKIQEIKQLPIIVARTEVGKKVEVKIWRNKKKIKVRKVTKEDIKSRNLPNQTTGLVIVQIENDSPLKNSIEVESIILEAQKKKIRSLNDLNNAVAKVLNSNQ